MPKVSYYKAHGEMVAVTLRIPLELKHAVEQRANDNLRSFSAEVIHALQQHAHRTADSPQP